MQCWRTLQVAGILYARHGTVYLYRWNSVSKKSGKREDFVEREQRD